MHQARVLLGEEVLVLGVQAVATRQRGGLATQVDELGDHGALARAMKAHGHRVAVLGALSPDEVEAAVALSRAQGGLRVGLLEVADNRLH